MSDDQADLQTGRRGADPWFRKAFGPFYQELYGHRDGREARDAVEILVRHLPIAGARGAGAPILDIACGAGRHLQALSERRLAGIGLDLSWFLLKSAPDRFRGRLVRGDMRRLPFRDGVFGAALSMFTSLGYFKDLEENRHVLAEAARVVGSGGGLAVDYFNARTTVENLVPSGRRSVGRYEVRETRRVTDTGEGVARIVKTVEILDEGVAAETLHEEVLVLDPGMIAGLVTGAGFEIVARFGDYDGSPFQEAVSPRFILVARKEVS